MSPFAGLEPGSFAEMIYRHALNLAVLSRCSLTGPLSKRQADYLAYLEGARKRWRRGPRREATKAADRDFRQRLKIGSCDDCLGRDCCPFRSSGTVH